MSPEPSIPPLRDLPPGHLEVRKHHLLAEINRRPERRLRLPSVSWSPWRLAGLAGAAAGTAVAVALVSSSGGQSPLRPNPRSAAPPTYSFHASITSPSPFDRYYRPDSLRSDSADYTPAFRGSSAFGKHIPRAVLMLASDQAHSYGNRGRTLVQWLRTTRQKAVSAENGGRVDGGNLRVYFVILHGHFVDKAASRPRGAKPPRGRILTDTIEIKTGRTLDFGIGNGEPNFSKIGKPHHFVISGRRKSR